VASKERQGSNRLDGIGSNSQTGRGKKYGSGFSTVVRQPDEKNKLRSQGLQSQTFLHKTRHAAVARQMITSGPIKRMAFQCEVHQRWRLSHHFVRAAPIQEEPHLFKNLADRSPKSVSCWTRPMRIRCHLQTKGLCLSSRTNMDAPLRPHHSIDTRKPLPTIVESCVARIEELKNSKRSNSSASERLRVLKGRAQRRLKLFKRDGIGDGGDRAARDSGLPPDSLRNHRKGPRKRYSFTSFTRPRKSFATI